MIKFFYHRRPFFATRNIKNNRLKLVLVVRLFLCFTFSDHDTTFTFKFANIFSHLFPPCLDSNKWCIKEDHKLLFKLITWLLFYAIASYISGHSTEGVQASRLYVLNN